MSAAMQVDTTKDTSGLGGHPRGLTTLFFTELWERFSYYGMRAILVLYMVAKVEEGGLAFDTKTAASIYGTYTMAVYLLSLPGGLIADKFLGARQTVLFGGIIIACGHFSMAFHSMTMFYTGLVLIALGTGLLKPNISTMVGNLYSPNDPRRDGGFSLFYMGINLGAFLAPLVCGYLAEGASFKNFIASLGFDPKGSWHFGFAAAGVGMVFGLIVYMIQRDRLAHVGDLAAKPKEEKEAETETSQKKPFNPVFILVYVLLAAVTIFVWYKFGRDWVIPVVALDALIVFMTLGLQEGLTVGEWKRTAAILILFFFTIFFWAAYEQKGASLNLFAKNLVNTQIFGWQFPASWLQSLTPLYVIILAPIFAALWLKLGDRQPSSPAKFTLGLLFIGLAYTLFVPACVLTAQGKVSPLWLVGLYFLEVMGEMCLSPVGLSTVTKLSPVKFVGLMMGAWFFATSLGNKLAGYIAGFYDPNNSGTLVKMYGGIAIGLLVSATILFLLLPTLRKLIGKAD